METCVWTYDDEHCYWETSCGESWWFEYRLEFARVKFCPGCGERISVAEEQS